MQSENNKGLGEDEKETDKSPNENLIQKISNSVNSNKEIFIVNDFKNSSKENEFLFFLKPEFFYIKDYNYIEPLLNLILKKIQQFNIEINGIATVKGNFLKKSKIIENHYGFINKMSMKASKIVGKNEKMKIKEILGIENIQKFKILGGHEVLEYYKFLNEDDLSRLWYSGHSVRISEGFYVQVQKINGDDVIIINGFNPSQIKHYTSQDSVIVLFLLDTDTSWEIIRNDFAGDTFPENAKKGSIRETLYRNKEKYNIKSINVAHNFIHASSGPFDAVFEICNFVGNIKDISYCKYNTNVYNLMTCRFNLDVADYENCLKNPKVEINNLQTDLFSLTKNKNTLEAIDIYIKYFKNLKNSYKKENKSA